MSPDAIAGMIFTIVVLAMVGGFILVLPITRRLGAFLEYRMSERTKAFENEDRERFLRAIEALRDDVARLAERQDWMERLLQNPEKEKKPGP
jgi:hypothetical protein